ncbi:MAG TPA: Flp family type IVb pilin [Aliidongia sp.]|uniref:Flp family type IVb pilin n=1 Tax=Aliidongia sp. TaxID=1914230 RepID=UPI002DDD03FA|nr:Flp family type IVb pilin [Aliidongia sp.]HEV2676371.1 Flp family type IVb pilin [Aliidongia sp.]
MKYVASAHHFLLNLGRDKRGVSAVEYALLASLIAVAIVATVKTFGTTLSGIFTTVGSSI